MKKQKQNTEKEGIKKFVETYDEKNLGFLDEDLLQVIEQTNILWKVKERFNDRWGHSYQISVVGVQRLIDELVTVIQSVRKRKDDLKNDRLGV